MYFIPLLIVNANEIILFKQHYYYELLKQYNYITLNLIKVH